VPASTTKGASLLATSSVETQTTSLSTRSIGAQTTSLSTGSIGAQTDDVIGAAVTPHSISGPMKKLPGITDRRFNNYVRKFTTGNGKAKFADLDAIDPTPWNGGIAEIRKPSLRYENLPARVIQQDSKVRIYEPVAGMKGWGRYIENGQAHYSENVFKSDFRPPGLAV